MKKLFLVLTCVSFLAACNSNKKNSSISQGNQESTQVASKPNIINNQATLDSGKIVNGKKPLDSLMANTGSSSQRYNFREGNFKGATGAGTGGSYAGYGYAQSRYKRKVKPKIKRVFDAPYEQEPVVNTNADTSLINKAPDLTINSDSNSFNGSSVNINSDSSGINNELTNFSESSDSSSVSKSDSTNLNSGW